MTFNMFSILDVGCGSHPWGNVNLDINIGSSEHHNYTFNPMSISNFTRASAEKLPYRNKSFDIVVCRHCLEHLPYPLDALKDFERVARKKVILIVPNNRIFFDHPTHLYGWSLSSFKNLIQIVFPHVTVYASTPLSELYTNRLTRRIMKQRDVRRPLGRLLAWFLGFHLYAICDITKNK